MKKILGFLAFLTLVSCVPTKRLTYLQENLDESENLGSYQLQRSSYKVQPNDILSITVRSFDEETTQLFNISNMSNAVGGGAGMGDIMFYLQGYSVNLQGKINMPIIGALNVENKTVEEVQAQVEEKLNSYFVEDAVNVTVQLAGIRYTVVGEVARPGKYVIFQNQVNIFEALAQAGDMTMVGDRKEVMIVRQMPSGVETFYLDLTDAEVINDFSVKNSYGYGYCYGAAYYGGEDEVYRTKRSIKDLFKL
jgi:polysaccharide export outer membrane protein